MTVYVDDMRRRARVGNSRPANWSHMFADTPDELRSFARRLGLDADWVQRAGTHREHFDVTDTVRRAALRLGAQHITYPRDTADLLARKKAAVCDEYDDDASAGPLIDALRSALDGAS